jgi:oxygen-independent coproporphyrinogen-3 oxidase
MAPSLPGAPIGVYIHVPFCAHICPYCDFNTYRGQEALFPRYVAATASDVAARLCEFPERDIGSIYFGGGTPSLLMPEQIGTLLDACRSSGRVLEDAEVTLEANPRGVDQPFLEGLRRAGVNRLSLGLQTTDRRGLRTLGRQHEAVDAREALLAARAAGFDNISLDLIYGWPGQTIESWRHDLESVLAWEAEGPDHLSLYSLIVEPGTPMADAVARGILTVVDDDATADMYDLAREVLGDAGWTHYEVSNWARTPERVSRHNLVYWRNGDYLGAGAGAHWQAGGRRVMNHLLPRTYIESIERGESPVSNREELDERTRLGETMMLGLRLLHEGIDEQAFAIRHGKRLAEAFRAPISDLTRLGLLEQLPDRLRLTPRGVLLANEVVARFL